MKISISYKDFSEWNGKSRDLSSSSEISDNFEKRPTELEGSRDARDKVFKAFRVFKGESACYSTLSLRKYSVYDCQRKRECESWRALLCE